MIPFYGYLKSTNPRQTLLAIIDHPTRDTHHKLQIEQVSETISCTETVCPGEELGGFQDFAPILGPERISSI